MTKFSKINIVFLFLFLFFSNDIGMFGQSLTGRMSSYIYSYKIQDQQSGSSQHARWYQTFVVNAKNIGNPNISLHLNTRYTKDFINDNAFNRNLKFQYMYGKVRNIFDVLDIKLGRQYIYSGVGSGSIDGIVSKLKIKRIGDFEIYAGMPVSWYHEAEIQKWDESRMYGFRIQPRMYLKTLASVSYTQKLMKPIPYIIPGKFTFKKWDIAPEAMELLGLDVYTQWSNNTTTYGRIDWDMTYEDIYRANFYYNQNFLEKFTFSAEYYYRKPRIYKNSIFSIFTQHDNQEAWFRIYYSLAKNLRLSGGMAVVAYSGDEGYRYNIGLHSNRFSIGYNHTNGYSGRLDGLTGSVNYPLMDKIWLRGGSNISRYKLFEHLEDFENILSTFAGLTYMPKKTCSLEIEGQGLHNYNYSSDLRILFRANYWFSMRKK